MDTTALFTLFPLKDKAMLLAEQRGDISLDRSTRCDEEVHLHQIMHKLEGLYPHCRRQILHDYGRFEMDDLFIRKRLFGRSSNRSFHRHCLGKGGNRLRNRRGNGDRLRRQSLLNFSRAYP